jgi:O-antigen ligase
MLRFSAERARRIAYAVLVAGAYFGFPIAAVAPVLLGMPSRAISVAYRVLVAAGSLLYVWWVPRTRRIVFAAPVQWALGLLALMLLARLAWDSYGAQLPLDLPWEDQWAEVLVFVLLPALPFLLVPDCEALVLVRSLCQWGAVVAVFAVAVGALYSVRHFSVAGRLATDVINPITIGELGVSLFIVTLSYPSTARATKTRWWRASARAAGGVLGITVCVLSASKGPLLSLAAVMLVMFVYRLTRLSPRRKLQELCAALVILGGLAALVATLNEHGVLTIYSRISEFASDQSTALRLQAWDGALAQFNSSPFWGSSSVELSTRFYPHNMLLEAMMATGVVGLLLLLLLQSWGAIAAHGVLISAPQYSWVALLFLQHAIGALLSGSLYLGGANWISLLMLLGVYQALGGTDAVRASPLDARLHT